MKYPVTTLVLNKGRWYVQCTIPEDLRSAFKGRKQIRLSTGTTDKKLAQSLEHDKTTEIYQKFDSMTDGQAVEAYTGLVGILGAGVAEISEDPRTFDQSQREALKALVLAAQLQTDQEDPEEGMALEARGVSAKAAYDHLVDVAGDSMSASEAGKEYLSLETFGRDKTRQEAGTALDDFVQYAGDVPISEIRKVLAYEWAEHLGQSYFNKTVKKKVGHVSRCLTFSEQKGWLEINPWQGLSLKRYGKKSEGWKPLSNDDLSELFKLDLPDHIRLLLSILLTTGMRLDEAALLEWSDLKEDDGIHYIDLTTKAGLIKNIGSARKVPIHSSIKHLLLPITSKGQVFPQFRRDKDGKAQNSASKACMKHIRRVTDDPKKVTHSLRGTFKDKLRDAGVPKELNDFLTGHGSGDVAGGYGAGPSLRFRQKAVGGCSEFRVTGLA